MEARTTPPTSDPALAALSDTEGAVRRMSWLAVGGLSFWLVVLIAFTLQMSGTYRYNPAEGILTWLGPGAIALLHIWPTYKLRLAARALQDFSSAPSASTAALALRSERTYWRAAGISHLIILLWIISLVAIWSMLAAN